MNIINSNKPGRKSFTNSLSPKRSTKSSGKMGFSLDSSSQQSSEEDTSESSSNDSSIGGGNKESQNSKLKLKLLLMGGGCLSSAMLILAIPIIVVVIIMALTFPISKAIDAIGSFVDKGAELFEKWGNFFTGGGFNTDEESFYNEINKVYEKNRDDYNVTIDVPLLMATLTYYNNNSEDQLEINDEKNKDVDYDGLRGDIKKLADAMINEREVEIKKTDPNNPSGEPVITKKTEYYLDTEGDNNKYKTYLFDTYFEKNPIKKLLEAYPEEEERKEKKEKMWQEILSMVELYKDFFKSSTVTGGFICGGVSPISNNGNTDYVVTSPFGMRNHPTQGIYKMHNGIDLVSTGTNGNNVDIVAVADGKITIGASCNEAMITIDHGTFKTRYIHLSTVTVNDGDTVTKGQVIGKMGGDPATGATGSTGSHLHFEYFADGINNSNPQELLDNIGVDDDTCEQMLNGGNIFVKINSNGSENDSKCAPNSKFGGDNVCSLETYVLGVVAQENGGCPFESCKAQAIAARTYFLNRILRNKAYTETTTTDGEIVKVATIQSNQKIQVYNMNTYNSMSQTKKQEIFNSVTTTAGMVLTNNGKIFSSQYLNCPCKPSKMYRIPSKTIINPNCTYNPSVKDSCGIHDPKTNSSYGMSQIGANNFAKEGKDFEFILDYYYDAEIQPFSEDLV